MSSLSSNFEANAGLKNSVIENGETLSEDSVSINNTSAPETTAVSENLPDEISSGTEAAIVGVDQAEDSTTGTTAAVETPKQNEGINPVLLVGGCAIAGALIAAIAFALFYGRKRKKQEEMEYNPTFEPYMNGSGQDMSVKVILDEKDASVSIGRIHDVGRRSMQQDSFGVSDVDDIGKLKKKGVMAVVADGMGGLSDGERMSQMVVVKMLQGFDASPDDAIPSSTLLGLVGEANEAVNSELGDERIGKCGSTVVAVILKDRKLSWISVGDSHIYVFRKGQLIQLNTDHNYGTELDQKVQNGEISFEEASTDPQRAALTSYIGIGELELIDQNETPIAMEKGDRILLMSDGVYGTVDERAIAEMMALPFRKALSAIDRAVLAREKNNQDNYTCVVIEVK